MTLAVSKNSDHRNQVVNPSLALSMLRTVISFVESFAISLSVIFFIFFLTLPNRVDSETGQEYG